MIKKEIYPKTKRVSLKGDVVLTEKIDGSNLVIFKLNDEVYLAQRNNIINVTKELEIDKGILYKGLYQWIKDNLSTLQENMHNNSALCGEWIGMGQLKYPVDEFDKRFYMFAKANITEDFELSNLIYNHDLFIYPFIDEQIPGFIGVVPEVIRLKVIPNKEHLDSIYKQYCEKVNRNVEGFVVDYNNQITKYVRMKNGTLQEHFDRE